MIVFKFPLRVCAGATEYSGAVICALCGFYNGAILVLKAHKDMKFTSHWSTCKSFVEPGACAPKNASSMGPATATHNNTNKTTSYDRCLCVLAGRRFGTIGFDTHQTIPIGSPYASLSLQNRKDPLIKRITRTGDTPRPETQNIKSRISENE